MLFVVSCACWFRLCCMLSSGVTYSMTYTNKQHNLNQQVYNKTNNKEWNQPLTPSYLLQCWTPYAVVHNLHSWRWTYRCPKHVLLFMIINHIVESSWYLSSFSYMMHGHTYIKFVKKELSSTSTHPMGPPGPVTGFPLPRYFYHISCSPDIFYRHNDSFHMWKRRVSVRSTWILYSHYFNTCTVHHLLFCTMTNKSTINWQIITLLLHVSTLLCYLQGVRS